MNNDPLDIIFLTKEERLAKYLAAMRPDLQETFQTNFQRISPAELAQLREDLQFSRAANVAFDSELTAARTEIAALRAARRE